MIPNNGSALETKPVNWKTINWKQVERSVKSFQLRIAKATVYYRVDETTLREPEPCESKGSSTVLRGQGRSNPPALPDKIKTWKEC